MIAKIYVTFSSSRYRTELKKFRSLRSILMGRSRKFLGAKLQSKSITLRQAGMRATRDACPYGHSNLAPTSNPPVVTCFDTIIHFLCWTFPPGAPQRLAPSFPRAHGQRYIRRNQAGRRGTARAPGDPSSPGTVNLSSRVCGNLRTPTVRVFESRCLLGSNFFSFPWSPFIQSTLTSPQEARKVD